MSNLIGGSHVNFISDIFSGDCGGPLTAAAAVARCADFSHGGTARRMNRSGVGVRRGGGGRAWW